MVHNFVSDLFGYCKCFDFCSQKVLHHSFVLCLNLKSLNFWTVDTRAATVGSTHGTPIVLWRTNYLESSRFNGVSEFPSPCALFKRRGIIYPMFIIYI